MKINHSLINHSKELVYLATPYSHPEALVREARYKEACRNAAFLMQKKGVAVFCPIAHSHPIEVHGMNEINDANFWLQQDFAVLKRCDSLYVLRMDGWKESVGVQAEIKFAEDRKIPVYYIDPIEQKFVFIPIPSNGPTWMERVFNDGHP